MRFILYIATFHYDENYIYLCTAIWKDDEKRTELDEQFEKLAPIYFQYERESNRSHEISTELKNTFLNGALRNDNETLNGLIELYADGVIGFGVNRFVRLASLFTRVYYYKNSYVGRYSHFYYPGDKPYGC